MKLLITGHKGYIGAWICKLAENNPQINLVGIDLNLFEGCEIEKLVQIPELEVTDIRKISSNMLNDIDVICHLAAISNDPMGELDSKITTDINLHGTLQLAELAKKAGVKKFIFSGSCSIYGSSADKKVDETGLRFVLVNGGIGAAALLERVPLEKLGETLRAGENLCSGF